MTTKLSQQGEGARDLLTDIMKTAEGLVTGITAPGATGIPPGLRRGLVSPQDAASLLVKIGEANAVFAGIRARGEARGATQTDRALQRQALGILNLCFARVNQLAASSGGLPGLLTLLNRAVGGSQEVITENDVGAVEAFVSCALEMQNKQESTYVTDAAVGAGLGFLSLAVAAAL